MDLKQPLTFSGQVEKLKEHGIILTDDERKDAEEYLSQVNYYKLTGYTLQFRKDAENSDLATPHTFSEITKLYSFDVEMRQMLRGYLGTTHERALQSACKAFTEVSAKQPFCQQLFSLCVSARSEMAASNIRAER